MMLKSRNFPFNVKIFPSVRAGAQEWSRYAHLFRKRDENYENSSYRINSPAALAILATWQSIMYRCYYSPSCTNLVICEDDVCFHKLSENLLVQAASTQLASQYDMIYLGANCVPPCDLRELPDASHEQLMQLQDTNRGIIMEINTYLPQKDLQSRIYGTFGLLLSRKMIEVLFQELRDLR